MGLGINIDTNLIELSIEAALQLIQVTEAENDSSNRQLTLSKGGIGEGKSINLKIDASNARFRRN